MNKQIKKGSVWYVIFLALTYSLLCYDQLVGVNYAMFFSLQGIYLYMTSSRKSLLLYLAIVGLISSAAGALCYGLTISYYMGWISIVIGAGANYHYALSIPASLFSFFYGMFSSWFDFINNISSAEASSKIQKSKVLKNLAIWLISISIVSAFVLIYMQSSVGFQKIVSKIDLSFISFTWLIYFMFTLYVLLVIHKMKTITPVDRLEKAPNQMNKWQPQLLDQYYSLKTEFKWANIMFSLLNALLLLVLITDTISSYTDASSQTITHSAAVHNSVNATIVSILLAIALLLLMFRGRLNFIKQNKTTVLLARIWVVLNLILVFTAVIKNIDYIDAYYLTYKRIGVFFYLMACVIGLVLVFHKVGNKKTNWFLVKYTAFGIYLLTFLTPLIPWNRVVTDYNFKRAHADNNLNGLEIDYLYELGVNNYAHLKRNLLKYDHPEAQEYIFKINDQIEMTIRRRNRQGIDWRSFNLSAAKSL